MGPTVCSRARSVAAALVLIAACSADKLPAKGELMLMLNTDMREPQGLGRIHVQVRPEGSGAGADMDFLVSELPKTYAIVAGSNAQQFVRITVSGYGGAEPAPKVVRELRTRVPADRIAEVSMGLWAACREGVKPSCGTDQTCDVDLDSGVVQCVRVDQDSATFPVYVKDHERKQPPQADGGTPPLPPPDGGTQCDGPSTQPCGRCGTQSRSCQADATWSAWGPCTGEGVCAPNATQSCGTGGGQTCTSACQWGVCVPCVGPSTQGCEKCGTQTRRCDGTTTPPTWSAWGACTGQGVCAPNETRACGAGGHQTCTAQCQWDPACTEQHCPSNCSGHGGCNTGTGQCACTPGYAGAACDTCAPGYTGYPGCCFGSATQACGNCSTGTQSRTCTNGTWSNWGACSGGGLCTPDVTLPCPGGGSQTCNSACQWGACACPSGMQPIPGGPYTMGCALDPSNNGNCTNRLYLPQQPVTVGPFCLDTTEVTVAAYRGCSSCTAPDLYDVSLRPYCNWMAAPGARENYPINCVDWNQAVAYCASLGKRLPTEQEWEWAARGGTNGWTYPWGNTAPTDQLLCWSGSGTTRTSTCPAGSFQQGPFGLFDMAGNVWEWTDSNVDSHNRVARGGGWLSSMPSGVRAAYRGGMPPQGRDGGHGFRCAR